MVQPGDGTATGAAGTAGAAREPTVAGRIDGLQLPWSTVYLPDGTAVISERDTALLRTIKGGQLGTLGKVPGVVPGGEGGLLGLALSPNFATDRYLYAYFTAAADNRIARMRLEERGGRLELGALEPVFTGIPKAGTHNGGRIRFGPDGFLYVGTGDSQRREQPQDRTALGGKILRLTPTAGRRRETRSARTRSTALATGTSKDWPGTARAGCGPANSAPTSTTSST